MKCVRFIPVVAALLLLLSGCDKDVASEPVETAEPAVKIEEVTDASDTELTFPLVAGEGRVEEDSKALVESRDYALDSLVKNFEEAKEEQESEPEIPDEPEEEETEEPSEDGESEEPEEDPGVEEQENAEDGEEGTEGEEESAVTEEEESQPEPDNAPAPSAGGNRVIYIDAGHQGKGNSAKEPIGPGASQTKAKVAGGTTGVATGKPEYQLTLEIALKLQGILTARGYDVRMIRTSNDVNISNAERAQMANAGGAAAFIRLHANGVGSQSANGAQTICQTAANPYNASLYAQSRKLSGCVLDSYVAATGCKKEYVSERDDMSGINWCQTPVTIIEMGYMTNPSEDLNMSDPGYQQKMAEGIANGIDAYFK